MNYKTTGIVLSYMKYGEYSIIVRTYTSAFGLQSYLVRGVRRPGNKSMQIGYFYPLVALDMVVNHNPFRELQRIKEVRLQHMYHTLPFVPEKQPYIAFFSGLLVKLTEPHDEPQVTNKLFSFVLHSLQAFDALDTGYAYFAVQFLAKLSHYIGVGIQERYFKAFADTHQQTDRLATHIMAASQRPYPSVRGQQSAPWAVEALSLLLRYYEQQWFNGEYNTPLLRAKRYLTLSINT